MKHTKTAKSINKQALISRLYTYASWLLLALSLPFIIIAEAIFTNRDWSLWQLWLSIREGYFLDDPVLYVAQDVYPHFYEPRRFEFATGIVFVALILVAIYALIHFSVRVLLRQVGRSKAERPQSVEDSVVFGLSGRRKYRQYQHTGKDARNFEVLFRHNMIILIANLAKPAPHVLIDAKSSKATRFLSNLHKRLVNASDLAVDGTSSVYYRIFAVNGKSSEIYSFMNIHLMSELVKISSVTDVEIVGDKLIVVYSAKAFRQVGGLEAAEVEVTKIVNAVEYSLDRANVQTGLLESRMTPNKQFAYFELLMKILFMLTSLLILSAATYNLINRGADQVFALYVIFFYFYIAIYQHKLKDLL